MAKRKKKRGNFGVNLQIEVNTRGKDPILETFYSGLDSEYYMMNGAPAAWIACFGATRNGRFSYDQVIYVRQCNFCPMTNGKIAQRLPIYHAAVLFMMGNELSHILLISDDYLLDDLLQEYKPEDIPCRDNWTVLRDYLSRIRTSQILVMEPREKASRPYQGFQCTSFPGWTEGESGRDKIVGLLAEDQGDVYRAANMTAHRDVDYVLDAPDIKIVLHHDFVFIDYKDKKVTLIQEDVVL